MRDVINAAQVRRDEVARYLGLADWMLRLSQDKVQPVRSRRAAKVLWHFYHKEVGTLKARFNYRPDRELTPSYVPEGSMFGLVWIAGRTAEIDETLAVVAEAFSAHPKHLEPVRRALTRELAALARARERLRGPDEEEL